MKKTLPMLGALLLGATLYNASAGIIITLDENGNGTWNNNGTITTLTFGSAASSDPVGPATLYYNLPSSGGVPLYWFQTYVSGQQLPLPQRQTSRTLSGLTDRHANHGSTSTLTSHRVTPAIRWQT
jgi:hypothetical protein